MAAMTAMTAQGVFWICVTLAAVIFGVMLWSVATFKEEKDRRRGASYLHSRIVEVLWALIPIAIFLGAAMPVQQMIAGNSRPEPAAAQLVSQIDR